MLKYFSITFFLFLSFVFLTNSISLSAKEIKNNQVDCIQINVDILSELGDSNSQQAISVLQKYLRQMKYLKLGPSGYYGQLTQNAVKVFQKTNWIMPTWNVDVSTRNKIKFLSCGNVTSKNEYKSSDFAWLIQDVDTTSQYGEPHQKITLQVGGPLGETYLLGEYPMNCNVVETTYYKGSDKISKSVNCWWAGAGKEIGVFLENDHYFVKIADLEEGTAYIKSTPVKFKFLLELKKTKTYSNSLITYSNFDFWFSISYPKSAYMKTKCWTDTKDELIPLEVATENNIFRIWYTKKLEDCQLVKSNSKEDIKFGDSGIVFQVYQAESKEDFIKKIYGSKCIIDTEKNESTLRFTQPIQSIKIKKSDSIKECIDNNSCPNERFTCAEPKMYFYDPVVKKWVAIQYSNADYYIQKYPTYEETMKKWFYDNEIIQSFKFFH